MDNSRRTDLAFKVLENVQNLIRFADAKINVLLIISGVSTTFILANFQNLYTSCLVSKIALGLFFLSFFVFVFFSMRTISPQSDKHTGKSVPKTIYFKHIASRIEVRDFIDDYEKLDDTGFLNDLLCQVFENSKIADKKFVSYNNSLTTMKVQIGLFFILIAIRFFI